MKRCPRCNAKLRSRRNICPVCHFVIDGSVKQPFSVLSVLACILCIAGVCLLVVALLLAGPKPVSTYGEQSRPPVLVPDDLTIREEDLAFNDERLYVDSQIILTVTEKADYEDIAELVEEADGVIIGYITFSGDYHIDFPKGKSCEELERLCEKWEQKRFVETASLNYAFRSNPDSLDYYRDPWHSTLDLAFSDGWSEAVPSGNNWWAEAIWLPSVWEMDIWDTVKPVKVGVMDSIFSEKHRDLENVIVKTWQNTGDLGKFTFEERAHGTHISGIIAAEMGNNVGIAGVASCASPELYCFAAYGNTQETFISTSMIYKYVIALMLEEDVKVINISMGFSDELVFAAQLRNTKALREVEVFDASMTDFLKKAISAGYDFLIVKSAGNTSDKYFVECPVSKDHPYGYQKETSNTSGALRQPCSAKYSMFAGISDPVVRGRIIVVGAAKQDSPGATNYTATDFSNYDCDVYAPGEKILSLVNGTSGTAFLGGTSQAAPVVTGIATLAWSVNPELSAIQVKEIILKSVPSIEHPGSNIPIVNAAVAVYYAQQWSTTGSEQSEQAVLLGTVYKKAIVDREEKNVSISDATVTLYSHDRDSQTVLPLSEGGFHEILDPGNYTVSVEAPGYISRSFSFELKPNDVKYLSVELQFQDQIAEPLRESLATFTCLTTSHRTNWSLTVGSDGAFNSKSETIYWEETAPDYPKGTAYVSTTAGRFVNVKKANNYCYTMVAANNEMTGLEGQTYTWDGVRYVVKHWTHFTNGQEFYLYLPGTPHSEFPEDLVDNVVNTGYRSMDEITPDCFVLYQPSPEPDGYNSLVFIGIPNSPSGKEEPTPGTILGNP